MKKVFLMICLTSSFYGASAFAATSDSFNCGVGAAIGVGIGYRVYKNVKGIAPAVAIGCFGGFISEGMAAEAPHALDEQQIKSESEN